MLHRKKSLSRRTGLACALALAAATVAASEPPELVNADFSEWAEGLPAGWTISVGATSGEGNPSRILPLEDGGIALEGDIDVGEWRYVGQSFPVEPGTNYQVRFVARAEGLTKGPRQFKSSYVGLTLKDAEGNPLSRQIVDVVSFRTRERRLVARAPDEAVTGEVGLFLAMTGRLEVRFVELTVDPRSSFEMLVEEMGRNYSRFDLLGVDWEALVEPYRERAEAAVSPEEFAAVVEPMLAELEDVHVWIELPSGKRIYPFHEKPPRNYDFTKVVGSLESTEQASRVWLTGRTRERYGYVAVFSLSSSAAQYDDLEKQIKPLLGLPGMIVDLRENRGGNEAVARRIAAIFADRERVYARSRIRAGPGHDEFEEGPERVIEPRQGRTYVDDPVVCLVGPGCVSSCEAFAMMMKALPHVTLVGQPTRGASANPTELSLPIGVTLRYSTWISMLPDGTSIEQRGVEPDVLVEHEGAGDPAFEEALRLLGERIASKRKAAESAVPESPPPSNP